MTGWNENDQKQLERDYKKITTLKRKKLVIPSQRDIKMNKVFALLSLAVLTLRIGSTWKTCTKLL